MYFELSFVRKYLSPRKKQLSVSLITLMSITVIALVVWLLLLFLSVTEGIERNWLYRLTALNAHLRIQPTEHYFSSYYYNIDLFSEASRFTAKTIGQKAESILSDPYNPEQDAALPSFIPIPERDARGTFIDPVKRAYDVLKARRLCFQDYELSGALLKLHLVRAQGNRDIETQLTQASYLASFPSLSPHLKNLILPPTAEDLKQLDSLAQRIPELKAALAANSKQQTAGIQTTPSFTHFENPHSIPPLLPYLVGNSVHLPITNNPSLGTAVLVAKQLRDNNGVKLGDQGFLSYGAPTASSIQEQHIPIYVAGFYDPGIMNVGSKCILVPSHVTQMIHASQGSYSIDQTQAEGLMVWVDDLSAVEETKRQIERDFEQQGIAPYWKVMTFREYDFAKDLLQQFESDKVLFSLIGTIILIVACCNIISLLILLVNNKKRDIGILQAMGASKKSIACIFGLSGAAIGMGGSLLGIGLACVTLNQLDRVVAFLSFIQGHEAFNALFFGNSLPRELSMQALFFVLITTPLLSLIAGFIPAIKACRLNPSEILKSP